MGFADRIRSFFGLADLSGAEFFDDLADLLVEGDLGARLAQETAEALKSACRKGGIRGEAGIKLELKRILAGYARAVSIEPLPDRLNVFLLLGVNGVGKTTTTAKLARHYLKGGKATGAILAAGDTFRAAAIDQLKIHGERLGLRVVAQRPGSDPGAVLYDAIEAARAESIPLVLADTAGRMHTKTDLVRELEKIDRVIGSRAPEANVRRLLAIDATTGQNGLRQAEIFGAAVKIDGLVLTKYDSTARGGIVLALARQLDLPTAFIGTGEAYEDLRPFETESFLDDFIGLPR
jgi:fused signal recognition particle receptor